MRSARQRKNGRGWLLAAALALVLIAAAVIIWPRHAALPPVSPIAEPKPSPETAAVPKPSPVVRTSDETAEVGHKTSHIPVQPLRPAPPVHHSVMSAPLRFTKWLFRGHRVH